MVKKLVSIYYSYGKGSGEELRERYIIEDTRKAREEIVEDYGEDDSYSSVESFYDGTDGSISFANHGGDWDEPTGVYIVIESKESALAYAESEYNEAINAIEHMFK